MAYFTKSSGSFACYDRDTSCWKTSQLLLTGDYQPYSEKWPKRGIMRRGQVYARPMSARRTDGNGCLSSANWPPPNSADNRDRGKISDPSIQRRVAKGQQLGLTMVVKDTNFGHSDTARINMTGNRPGLFSTPSICGNYNRKGASKTSGDGISTQVKRICRDSSRIKASNFTAFKLKKAKGDGMLATGVLATGGFVNIYSTSVKKQFRPSLWPTVSVTTTGGPTGLGGGSGNKKKLKAMGFEKMATGMLNPDWTETLMGLPIRWTCVCAAGYRGSRHWGMESSLSNYRRLCMTCLELWKANQ